VRSINEINDPRLVKALAHPLRVSILSALEHRTASPSELADELGVPLPNLSYHIRMLVQLDLLKLVKTRPRRGAIEHYYRATGPVMVTDKAWGQLPELVKTALVSGTLQRIGKQVDEAAAAGGFDGEGSVLNRSTVKLDSQAFQELCDALIEIERLSLRLQDESEKRRKSSNHTDEFEAGLIQLLFKSPPPATPASGDGDDPSKQRKGSSRSRASQSKPVH
jgi:DNA-binding transcriptional ArsR family regulator